MLDLGAARIDLADGDRTFRLEVEALRLEPGQMLALTGSSGSGKTLLLELLGLLRAPGQGTRFRWLGETGEVDLAALWSRGPRNAELSRLRGRLFGFVPQTGGLMPFLSVAENIALPQRVNGAPDPGRVEHLMERLGLSDIARLRPDALSIGQRQRTAIARALSHRPPFVIADEPTAALDPETSDRVLDLLLDAARAEGSGVILSSHDIDRIERFAIPRVALSAESAGGTVTSRLEGATC
ncbi:ABC transporter ATP-binding protein [Albibacillus kandeliae]|uniref:ABC transporter ATP-binding protein n=1 Tax=Albibacillus kandeliae TaxID=2174228 RepID=UPI000D692093|nr:ATP-binding cassette domain-containing protein [Albibacillus kandeliae]